MQGNQIGFIVGSLRKGSINRQLAQALIKLLPSGFNASLIEIGDLPLYNQDHDGAQPAAVVHFKEQIAQANGIVFVTPEYNRSVPGVLKNALDHGSRPWGDNTWQGKPAGVLGTSSGAIGTALAQQHLRNILVFLAMPTLTQPEVFLRFEDGLVDQQGRITNEKTRTFLQSWVDAYIAWFKKINL